MQQQSGWGTRRTTQRTLDFLLFGVADGDVAHGLGQVGVVVVDEPAEVRLVSERRHAQEHQLA